MGLSDLSKQGALAQQGLKVINIIYASFKKWTFFSEFTPVD